jgi:hypothetical protein
MREAVSTTSTCQAIGFAVFSGKRRVRILLVRGICSEKVHPEGAGGMHLVEGTGRSEDGAELE